MIKNKSFLVVVSIFVLAVVSRLLPHLPNFTPVMAIALFGGAFLRPKYFSVLIPMVAMFVADYILSIGSGYPFLHSTMLFVYVSMFLTTVIGWWIAKNPAWNRVLVGALGSSALFFIITNLGVFTMDAMYPMNASGLLACYTAALPFFRNEFLGNLFYTAILFGSYALIARTYLKTRVA